MPEILTYLTLYFSVGIICAVLFESSLRSSVSGVYAVIATRKDDVFDKLSATPQEHLLLALQVLVVFTWPGWVVFDVVARVLARLLVKKAIREASELSAEELRPPADRSDDQSDS